jgi:hypothetical protein
MIAMAQQLRSRVATEELAAVEQAEAIVAAERRRRTPQFLQDAVRFAYTIRMANAAQGVAAADEVMAVQSDQFRLQMMLTFVRAIPGFAGVVQLDLAKPHIMPMLHAQVSLLNRALTDARHAVLELQNAADPLNQTATPLPSEVQAKLGSLGAVESKIPPTESLCHKAKSCTECSNQVDCGWCVASSKCVPGGYHGSQAGANEDETAGCPVAFPAKTADSIGGVSENWIFNPQSCPRLAEGPKTYIQPTLVAEHCLNGVQDADEEGIDCGGACTRHCGYVVPKWKFDQNGGPATPGSEPGHYSGFRRVVEIPRT